ncbi:MAG: hypothetical protein AB7O45_03615 [Alphaproteobacteria bacterium]
MIVHVTTPDNNRTLSAFIAGPAREAGLDMRSMTYAELSRAPPRTLPRATWIFSDTDILDPGPAARAAHVCNALAARGDRLLNHPTRSMARYELLRALRHAGINDFDVYRATDARAPQRYPVFVRWINAHTGPLSPLLANRNDLQRFYRVLLGQGWPRDVLMAVEHCDTREASGLVRQYGAFRVGATIIPEHLWFSERWAIKAADGWEFEGGIDRSLLYAEEERYVAGNPHEPELRRIFDLARIEYGRIDYGMLDGRIQVWEINTNPDVTLEWRARPGRDSSGLLERFMVRFTAALAGIGGTEGTA